MHLVVHYFNAQKQDVCVGVGIFISSYQRVFVVLQLTHVHNALFMYTAGRSTKCAL